MAFIDRTDLERYIDAGSLDQILDGSTTIVPEAAEEAVEFMSEKLRQRYNTTAEFALTGANRNKSLLKQCIVITLYYVNQRIPTSVVPESRAQDYEDALLWLKEVSTGQRMLTLEENDPDNQVGFPVRYGNRATKQNDNFI